MARFLVTGAAGFLGFALARKLADDPKNEVIVVDNFLRGERDDAYRALCVSPNVSEFAIDLTSLEQVRTLPQNVDYVLHMAALNGTQNFYERPFEVVRSCTLPTIHLLEHYGDAGVRRFVYAGTSEAYASTVTIFDWPVPTSEEVPLCVSDVFNPRWSYGASKMHGEIAVANAANFYGLPVTIVRFHNAYGPRMGDKHVIPDFYARARDGRYELFGHEDTRSFIYVDDAVRATLLLTEADAAAGQIVNVGGDEEVRIVDLGRTMMAVAGLDGEIVLHPSPSGSVKRRAPDLRKLKEITGYEPNWSLTAGLRETARFYLA